MRHDAEIAQCHAGLFADTNDLRERLAVVSGERWRESAYARSATQYDDVKMCMVDLGQRGGERRGISEWEHCDLRALDYFGAKCAQRGGDFRVARPGAGKENAAMA